MIAYLCTYLWGISIVLLVFVLYASLRGPLNLLNHFTNGKCLMLQKLIDRLSYVYFVSVTAYTSL